MFSMINFFACFFLLPSVMCSSDIPKISKSASSESLKESSYFSATCSVNQGALPLFFTWHKDNQVIADTNVKIISMSERISTLIIEKVSANDSGNYTCNVRNTFGNDEHTISLIIKGIDDLKY